MVAINFMARWALFSESDFRLLGLVLGSNLGLDGGVAVTGKSVLVLETDFFLSFLAHRGHMRPRLPVRWA